MEVTILTISNPSWRRYEDNAVTEKEFSRLVSSICLEYRQELDLVLSDIGNVEAFVAKCSSECVPKTRDVLRLQNAVALRSTGVVGSSAAAQL